MQRIADADVKAAFQGDHGAFSEDAARKLLGSEAATLPFRKFDDMFDAVSSEQADCCVAPIENSLAGSIHQNYDLMVEHNLTIIGEVNVRIVHNLIVPPGVEMQDVRRVYSHPVALAQCGRFLKAHPGMEAEAAYDTAGGVKIVIANGRRDEAAIAGRLAAATYGAAIIAEAVEDNPQNFTRFLLLARPEHAASISTRAAAGPRKTSIMYRVANKPGALFRSLAAFSLRDVDLCKIESRPIEGRPWEYSFYVDLAGDRDEPRIERAIAHLGEMTESIRVLGSYPSAEAFN